MPPHGALSLDRAPSLIVARMKTHDALGRRLATAGRQPTGKVVRPTEARLRVLTALARHGPLPAPILYAFSPTRGYDNFRKTLRDLYHERSVHGGAYLERPFVTPRRRTDARALAVDCQPAVYRLTDAGRAALEAAYGPDDAPRGNAPLVHQLLTAATTASIELAARQAGCRYLSTHDLLADARCPEATRQAANPLRIPVDGTALIPDALFGLEYPDGRKRRFALELDRGTEPQHRSGAQRNTVQKKLSHYPTVYERGRHQHHWGFPRFVVLMLTTSEQRVQTMRSRIPRWPALFLFKAQPDLGAFWEVPTFRPELFETPWTGAHGPVDISRA